MLLEPAFEQTDRGGKLVVERDQQIDIVEILLAAETVGQVVAWVDRGQHFAAARTEEAEIAFAHLSRRSLAAQGGDGHGHGQIVAQPTQQLRGYHDVLQGRTLVSRNTGCQKSTRSLSFCQCGCISTRLTVSMSMVFFAARTASIRQLTPRLRALRSTPSAERTINSTAGTVKV